MPEPSAPLPDTSHGVEIVRRARIWCESLGLRSSWLFDLNDESSDWSFCVKLAAIAEDAVIETLQNTITPPELASIVTKRPQKERINLIQTLTLLNQNEADGLRAIAMVRNGYAHGVSGIERSVGQFLDRTDKAGLGRFNLLKNAYVPAAGDTPMPDGWLVENHPRTALWAALVSALSALYLARREHDLLRPPSPGPSPVFAK